MEQSSQKSVKLLLIINLVISILAFSGVGYLIYDSTQKSDQPKMEMPNGGQNPFGSNGSNQQQDQQTDSSTSTLQ